MNKLWLFNPQTNCIFIVCLDNLVSLYDWGDILLKLMFSFSYLHYLLIWRFSYVLITVSECLQIQVIEGPILSSLSK